jgi:hypothetical protein
MTRTVNSIPLPLIEASPTPPAGEIEQTAQHFLEPAFRIAYQGHLRVDARGWALKAKVYYAHAIARTPRMLWLRVQRIYLLLDMADPDIHGALIDLFLVLDGKGGALRKRMLSLASALLQPEAYQQLLAHLPQGAACNGLCSRAAVLSSGQFNHETLIWQEMSDREGQTLSPADRPARNLPPLPYQKSAGGLPKTH